MDLVNIGRNPNMKSPQKPSVLTVLGNINENNHELEQSSMVDVKKTRYGGNSNHNKENGKRTTERPSCSSANFTKSLLATAAYS
ncbi:hypothetical protein TSAR_011502 [Trichomalopsis sarcophagae]|uniref:Uncharacterized protein n=1 Tax=Trichomalopsis sarcophagae TaxID=543379 RepID=A0A232FKA9_9HYME|nr:hypothetical protein TSAR_011502 [Trichomalopsis sarcophagae]